MSQLRQALLFAILVIFALAGAFFLLRSGTETVRAPIGEILTGAPTSTPVTRLMFVGDIMLTREVGNLINKSGDWRYPFLKIASTTAAADITFGNLETSVSDRGRKIGSMFSFRSDPRTVAGLNHAGFNILSLANNHIWDYADEAFMDTQMHLENAGIAYAGAGADYEAAHRPVIIERNGTKFAFLAYTNLLPQPFLRTTSKPASAGYADWNRVLKDIRAAKEAADVIIVSYHWGNEYDKTANPLEKKVAHDTIDAGAALVIGHHPHVQQEIEKYKNGWIVYSLGNFVFDQYFSEDVKTSRIFEVDFDGTEIIGAKEIPVYIPRSSQPELRGDAKSL